MSTSKSLLRLLLVVLVAGVLAACNTATPTPPEPEYVIEIEGQLEAHEYDSGANFWIQALTQVDADWSYTFGWLDPPTPINADGTYALTIDAREFPGEPLAPEEYGSWQLFPFGDDVIDVTVSNPNAKLRVLNRVSLNQAEPTGPRLLGSHSYVHYHQVESNGTTLRYPGTLVFSDAAVSIDGTAKVADLNPHRVIDLDLEPGWNLVHSTPSGISGQSLYVSEPLASQPAELVRNTRVLGSRATRPPASELKGYSVYAAHQVLADEVSSEMYAALFPSGTSILTANAWYGVNDPGAFLVPFADALPFGDAATGSVVIADSATNAVVADVRYYDETAVNQTSWWTDPSVATGTLQLEAASSNVVVAVYVDRSTVLESLDYEEEGNTVLATDVNLYFGWNLLEVVEIDETTVELVRLDPAESPTWDMYPY